MSFFVSSKPNRASVMVRSQRDMLMTMNSRTGMFGMRAQLAAWYYIQEDVKDVPEFVRYIYACARKCIENNTGMKVTDLAYGSVHLFRKKSGAVAQHGRHHRVNVGSIATAIRNKAETGNQRCIGYVDDINAWYDEFTK